MSIFKLPELGEGLEEGEIVGWRVKEGERIEKDSTMVEIMTDKATVEVPSPSSGTVKKIYYKMGELAKVGAPLIEISEEAGSATAPEEKATAPEVSSPAPQVAASMPYAPTGGSDAPSGGTSKVLASPAVRKMAREMNIDLSMLQGSGDRGRILRSDLEGATSAGTHAYMPPRSQPVERQLEERIPFLGIRRKIAEKLSQSKFTAVHFNHYEEADFSEIIKLRKEANEFAEKTTLGVKVSYLPFFIKASIAAMRKFPILNSSLDEDKSEVVIKHYFHFGISVQTDNGLMVAVVRDCDKKNIFELAKEIKDVADRARSGKASRDDLTGSTITITNPGSIGGIFANPIINYPETVILGMFGIKKRPVVKEVNGQDIIVAKPMMFTNITCDHRVIDGAIAAGYLRLFCEYIENPAKIAFF